MELQKMSTYRAVHRIGSRKLKQTKIVLGGTRSRGRTGFTHDDKGSVLILALVFVLVVGGVVASLADWVMNDLNNTAKFASVRSLQYAATSAINTAIQDIRYAPFVGPSQTLNASPPSYCWGNGPSSIYSSIDGAPSIYVWCSTAWTPTSAQTRVVTLSACPSSVTSASICAQNPELQALVTFDDYPPNGISAPNTALCNVYCGTGMTVDSWTWSPTVPTISSIGTNPTGSISGNTSVAITGTGFVTGSTVNFVEESNNLPLSSNVVVPASAVTVNSLTSITATSPAVIQGSTYFVTVTTPTGTSAYAPSYPVFTYTQTVPSITAMSPNIGPISGGTSVTITGSAFYAGSTVNFVEVSNASVTVPATNVEVISPTEITAVSPVVIQGSAYYVVVSTPSGGPSATGNASTFTYNFFYPLVASVSPNAGPVGGGTSVTITGTGFYMGSTVTFEQESNGTVVSPGMSFDATNVTVSTSTSGTGSGTTITATSPQINLSNAGSYFVIVTLPNGLASSNTPIFTFS